MIKIRIPDYSDSKVIEIPTQKDIERWIDVALQARLGRLVKSVHFKTVLAAAPEVLVTPTTPVEEVGFNNRVCYTLRNAGIDVLGQLVIRTAAELFKLRNFGKHSYQNVVDILTYHGLSLGYVFDDVENPSFRDPRSNAS